MTNNSKSKQKMFHRKRNAPHNETDSSNFKKMRYIYELQQELKFTTSEQSSNNTNEIFTTTNIPRQVNKHQQLRIKINFQEMRYVHELENELTIDMNVNNKNNELLTIANIPTETHKQPQKLTEDNSHKKKCHTIINCTPAYQLLLGQ